MEDKRYEMNTVPAMRYPDGEVSQTIGLLRWVLMGLVVLIHTNLTLDTGYADSAYGEVLRWGGNVVWLANPLFFLISGYLFVAAENGFTWSVFKTKCKRRARTWLLPYLLWNTIFLLFYGIIGWLMPSSLGEVPPIQEMGVADILKSYCCIRGEGFNSSPIDEPLWFLRDLMVIALFTPLYFRVVKWHKASLIVPIALAAIPYPLGFEAEVAMFMLGCWLHVWLPSLSELLRKPLWLPLPIYIAASLLVTVPAIRPEWSVPLLTFIRNLSGMWVVAHLCYRFVLRHPSTDWRAIAKPVFFVFAFHRIATRILTKLSAQWLVAHGIGSVGFLAAHLLNASLAIGLSLLAYHLVRIVAPPVCRWLSGFSPDRLSVTSLPIRSETNDNSECPQGGGQ